jgi:hypothetical protein
MIETILVAEAIVIALVIELLIMRTNRKMTPRSRHLKHLRGENRLRRRYERQPHRPVSRRFQNHRRNGQHASAKRLLRSRSVDNRTKKQTLVEAV